MKVSSARRWVCAALIAISASASVVGCTGSSESSEPALEPTLEPTLEPLPGVHVLPGCAGPDAEGTFVADSESATVPEGTQLVVIDAGDRGVAVHDGALLEIAVDDLEDCEVPYLIGLVETPGPLCTVGPVVVEHRVVRTPLRLTDYGVLIVLESDETITLATTTSDELVVVPKDAMTTCTTT